MSLNTPSCASNIDTGMDSYLSTYPAGNFTNAFVSAYSTYSKTGVLSSGGGIQGTEDSSILTDFFNSFSSYTDETTFATALANYWATCLNTPVPPATALVNNATSKINDFKSAILAAYSTTETTPHYLSLIQNVEDVAKTIQWTVTLSVPPFTRIETVS